MSKKKLVALFAAALMTLTAGSAFASFGDNELIRVYYERTTGVSEYATDLGSIASLTAAGASTTVAGTWGAVGTPANLYAVYFAVNQTTPTIWVSGSTDTAPVSVGGGSWTTTKSGVVPTYSTYNAIGGTSVVSPESAQGYRTKLSASQGSLGGDINAATRPNTEISLASLVGQTSGSITSNLYAITGANLSGHAGVAVATITTNFDGSSTITAPTPIPPAFFLMGSGLLGMVGLRRKSKKA